MSFEVRVVLGKIVEATEGLLGTAAAFNDVQVRQPSLLPGWSRGHVLTHLARNADGGTRMLTWARTGVVTPEYGSGQSRARDIEAGSGRPAKVLLADVRDSAARFAEAFESVPQDAWSRVLRWTSGKRRPAYRVADSRLTEVLVHHVDLAAAFGPADWPADFVATALADVVAAFGGRAEVPALHLVAVGTDAEYWLGGEAGAITVRADQAKLLAWLLGRAGGVEHGQGLPALPFLF